MPPMQRNRSSSLGDQNTISRERLTDRSNIRTLAATTMINHSIIA
jgi:hypothetical protein